MSEYYLFYKPYQVLSQFSAEGYKKTLADFFTDIPKNIYPAGRLDYDSEGLLLLTNDNSLAHRLLNPLFGHRRTYWVQVEGKISDEAIQLLREGVMINIDGKQYKTKKAGGEIIETPLWLPARNPPVRFRKNIPTSWVSLTLTEGKNRQVRRMTAAVGYPTLRLVRYAIGRQTIEGLLPGEYKVSDEGILKTLLETG